MKRLCCSAGPWSSHHVLTEAETDAVTRGTEMRNKQEIVNPNGKVSWACTSHALNGESRSTRETNGLSFLSAFY